MQLQWRSEDARLAAIQAVTADWTPDDVYEFLGGSEVSMEAHRTFENGVVRLASLLGPFRRFNLAHPKLLILR
jgi:hypothetical protein